MPTHNKIYIAPSHTKKIFGNMRREGKGFSGRETSLFQTMVVQNQTEIDEAVYKELDDSLVRVATTASSLEAEQDSGNINKTRSKATPNKSSSLGTTSGCGPRVESYGDKESLGEDASKQGRINAIDADEDITLVNDQDDADMFNVNTLTGNEVLAEQEVAAKDVNLIVDGVTLAQALAALKKEPVKPKKKDLIRLDEEIASELQAEFDEEERLVRETDEANIVLTEEWDDIQAKIEADHELAQRLQAAEQEGLSQKVDDVQETGEVNNDQEAAKIKELMEMVPDKEEVAIDVVHLAVKPPSIMYLVFSHMLKSFDREDLETLWKLVKAKHGSTRPEEGYERVLWGDLKINMLVEKKYHLTPATITDMLNKKIQWRIVGIKRLLDDLRVTATQLMLLVYKLLLVTPPNGAWTEYVSGGDGLLSPGVVAYEDGEMMEMRTVEVEDDGVVMVVRG
ncbi:hypothetical protein Tco_0612999 [Tanacetum coccineum]